MPSLLCLRINQRALEYYSPLTYVLAVAHIAHNCRFFDVSAFWNGSEQTWTDRFWKKNAKRMAKQNLKLGKNNFSGPRVNLWPLIFWISFCRVWNIWTASLLPTLGLQLPLAGSQRSKSSILSDSMCRDFATRLQAQPLPGSPWRTSLRRRSPFDTPCKSVHPKGQPIPHWKIWSSESSVRLPGLPGAGSGVKHPTRIKGSHGLAKTASGAALVKLSILRSAFWLTITFLTQPWVSLLGPS